jgi:hypothetical protein
MLQRARAWWRNLRPTERRRLVLVLMLPLVGLIFTGYQLERAIFGTQQVQIYDVTPAASIAPSIEPSLFEINFANQPLITDDVFYGLHKQISADRAWIEKLDVEEARKHGADVWPTIDNVRQLLGAGTFTTDSVTVNVRKTTDASAEVGLTIDYNDQTGKAYPVGYTLVYEIKRTEPVSSQGFPTYAFNITSLDSDVAGLSSNTNGTDGYSNGQEIIN